MGFASYTARLLNRSVHSVLYVHPSGTWQTAKPGVHVEATAYLHPATGETVRLGPYEAVELGPNGVKRTLPSSRLDEVSPSFEAPLFLGATPVLSYCRTDSDLMRALTRDLRQLSIEVWSDSRLEAGDSLWSMRIERAIEAAPALVLLATPASKTSPWVRREISYANTHGVRVIPFLAKGDKASSLPIDLENTQFIDGRDARRYGMALAALARALGEDPSDHSH